MMRNLLLLFLIFSSFAVTAQLSISIDPPTIHGEGSVDEQDIEIHTTIMNTSDTMVNLLWTRYEVEKPDVWWTWICDLQACYAHTTSQAPSSRTNNLRPGETMEFQVHAKAFGEAGFAEVRVDLYDASDTSNVLGSVQATFEAGTTSTLDIFDTDAIRVYPNPTTDYFRIFQADHIANVEVYNMVGKRVKFYPASPEGSYDVTNLAEGMYLVRMLDKQNSVIKTVRLSKG